MAKITVDPKLFNTSNPPEDDYTAIIKSIKSGKSKSGNVKGTITLELTSNPSDGDEETIGRKVLGNLTITAESMWKVNELYKAVSGDDMEAQDFESEEELLQWLRDEVIGQQVDIRVEHRTYENQTRCEVAYLSA